MRNRTRSMLLWVAGAVVGLSLFVQVTMHPVGPNTALAQGGALPDGLYYPWTEVRTTTWSARCHHVPQTYTEKFTEEYVEVSDNGKTLDLVSGVLTGSNGTYRSHSEDAYSDANVTTYATIDTTAHVVTSTHIELTMVSYSTARSAFARVECTGTVMSTFDDAKAPTYVPPSVAPPGALHQAAAECLFDTATGRVDMIYAAQKGITVKYAPLGEDDADTSYVPPTITINSNNTYSPRMEAELFAHELEHARRYLSRSEAERTQYSLDNQQLTCKGYTKDWLEDEADARYQQFLVDREMSKVCQGGKLIPDDQKQIDWLNAKVNAYKKSGNTDTAALDKAQQAFRTAFASGRDPAFGATATWYRNKGSADWIESRLPEDLRPLMNLKIMSNYDKSLQIPATVPKITADSWNDPNGKPSTVTQSVWDQFRTKALALSKTCP